jgi:hypothetical protein
MAARGKNLHQKKILIADACREPYFKLERRNQPQRTFGKAYAETRSTKICDDEDIIATATAFTASQYCRGSYRKFLTRKSPDEILFSAGARCEKQKHFVSICCMSDRQQNFVYR